MSDTGADVWARLGAGFERADLSWSEQCERDGGKSPQAAVLVALSNEAAPTVLLGRRAMHLRHHPGEVAFAGGKREIEDISPWATALREAQEEVGLAPSAVLPIAELPPMMTRTGFQVFPCIGRVAPDFSPVVDREEFDSVFALPLSIFADTSLYRLEVMSDGGRSRKVPHFQIGKDDVWGVTAAILVLLANVAYDAGLNLQRDWESRP